LKAHRGVTCFDRHANGHANASTHTVADNQLFVHHVSGHYLTMLMVSTAQ
jgi:hypothetical protein